MAGSAKPGYDPGGGTAPIPDNPAATALENVPNLDSVTPFPGPAPEGSTVDQLIGEKSEVGQPFIRYVSGSGGVDATQPGSSAGQSDVRDPGGPGAL